MWFLLALSSAIIYAFRGVLEKSIIHRIDKYILGFATRIFALPFFFIPFIIKPSLITPIFHANLSFWSAVLIVSLICSPFEVFFYTSALKEEELTTVLPILSLGPIITLFIASITLKEVPSLLGLLGVGCIAFGVYAVKIKHMKEGIFEPFKHLGKNKAIRFMFLVMISQSIGAVFDKVGVTNSSAYVYAVFNYILVSLSLFLLVTIKARPHLKQLATNFKSFLLLGLIVSSYTFLYLLALESGFAAYVSAIKSTYILFGIILGLLLLKEKEGKQKLFAGIVIAFGLILLKLFS